MKILDLDPTGLAVRINRLPVDQRRKIAKWIAASELKRAVGAKLRRAIKKSPVQPSPRQAAMLVLLATHDQAWSTRDRTLSSCMDRGWARRSSSRVIITPAGRAWLDALSVRVNLKTAVAKAIAPSVHGNTQWVPMPARKARRRAGDARKVDQVAPVSSVIAHS